MKRTRKKKSPTDALAGIMIELLFGPLALWPFGPLTYYRARMNLRVAP